MAKSRDSVSTDGSLTRKFRARLVAANPDGSTTVYDEALIDRLNVPQSLQDTIVKERVASLARGEGLSARELAKRLDRQLNPQTTGQSQKFANIRRAVSEYLQSGAIGGGKRSFYVEKMKQLLCEYAAPYFLDSPLAAEAINPLASSSADSLRKVLEQVDEITVGYFVCSLGDKALAKVANDYIDFDGPFR